MIHRIDDGVLLWLEEIPKGPLSSTFYIYCVIMDNQDCDLENVISRPVIAEIIFVLLYDKWILLSIED